MRKYRVLIADDNMNYQILDILACSEDEAMDEAHHCVNGGTVESIECLSETDDGNNLH